MKIEEISKGGPAVYRITDASGNQVILKPDEALLVLQFLYERVDDLTRQVNDLDTGEQAAQAI
jgi:hypothetical protein